MPHSALSVLDHRFGFRCKPRISIQLNGEGPEPTQLAHFSAGEEVSGNVRITVPHNTPVGAVDIVFEGRSQTAVEQSSVCTGWQHVFLKTCQSISASDYPSDRILRANQEYTFPFVFGIPSRISPCVCDHPCDSHSLLPPTLGDREIPSDIASVPSSMMPDAGQITYRVKVTILQESSPQDAPNILSSARKPIWIIPISDIGPKLPSYEHASLVGIDEPVCMEKLSSSHGILRMETSPRKPIQLLQPDQSTGDSWTFTKIKVIFESKHHCDSPPQIRSLRTRLAFLTSMKASTRYYNRQAILCPTKDQCRTYTRYLPMSHMEVSHKQWERSGIVTPLGPHTSLESLLPLQVEGLSGDLQHTMEFIIPIKVPRRDRMVASFDSCLISRSYLLDVTLSYRPRGKVLNQKTTIQVPLQFSS